MHTLTKPQAEAYEWERKRLIKKTHDLITFGRLERAQKRLAFVTKALKDYKLNSRKRN